MSNERGVARKLAWVHGSSDGSIAHIRRLDRGNPTVTEERAPRMQWRRKFDCDVGLKCWFAGDKGERRNHFVHLVGQFRLWTLEMRGGVPTTMSGKAVAHLVSADNVIGLTGPSRDAEQKNGTGRFHPVPD